ncbi:outer membrane beta-barrel protein [Terricaulis silvestris]|uniref:Beta-barrel porin 2 n=1 Tax=Terricaulis silvestris TaxID=2686094 RepID=A0A6I6MP98_9CAUL|nr:outer membrane beta-barrel protein [Terricaulis silvestris]QGZ93382.1 hypothetical protein DSM104635_00192 [Terricaulis silvestris]
MKKVEINLPVMAAALGWSFSAGAQDDNVSVRGRPKPEYDASGISVGTFKLYPEMTLSAEYDDNIFATQTDPQEDLVFNVSPSLTLASQWSVHELNLALTAHSRSYNEFSQNDTTDYGIAANGRLDVLRDLRVQGGASYGEATEPLSRSPTSLPLAEPIKYTNTSANLELVKEFSTVRVSTGARYSAADYEDGVLFDLSPVDQDDRDRTVLGATLRVDVAVSPATSLFASVSGNQREYDREPPDVLVNRNSEGYEALVGASFEVTSAVSGEIGVGYLNQTYEDPAVGETSGLAVRADLQWNPDDLVTVSLSAAREVADAGAEGAASYVANNINVGLDYEWRRNVVLSVNAGYSVDDYNGVDREDTRWDGRVRAEYLANSGVAFYVEAGHYEQRSEGLQLGREYDVDRATVGIRLRR